ncbi:Protein SERAC1 [Madurella mycetomatis]|uniref:Protein SERAC1 n=1 Tax=Madurella mycetomatis TaxID=100816 RepID=A0A175W9L0_9PEZI|nr:Protein SERAC1 [Madurella mycetomatis]
MDRPEGRGAIPPTGLSVVFEPDDPSLDIVFVHGFTGHPERTWTKKVDAIKPRNNDRIAGEFVEPPPKIRRLNPFSTSHFDKGDGVPATYWPRDLLPQTIPSARVLTYGYDTHIRHWVGPPVNRNTVYDISWDFLIALESERRTEPSRPVVFVAHSLGGIIVKEMLRRSRGCHMAQTHLHDIFKSTMGIIFFGTPHAGADPRRFLHRIVERAIKAAGFSVNEQIVNTLLPSSERLRELRHEFGPMAQEQNWIIHSFQEQVGVGLLSNQKVVDDTSSYLNVQDIETTEHIRRNHMEMCRFMGLDDVEYKKVAAALHRITMTVSRKPTAMRQLALSEEQKRELLDSLRFDQIDARQMTIKKAHIQTCKWLLETSEYLDWLNPSKLSEHHGFLWIKGKPGTGKSTLMKFALANARKNMKDSVVISFFFNARGDDLEKSTAGLYRSLLLQLLERLPVFQDVFNSLGLRAWNGGRHQWSIESLKVLFEEVVQGLGEMSVTCFIDALDECDEGQIRDMISFFGHVGELTTKANPPIRFLVCLSSRHYPHITIAKGLGLVLEGHEEHSKDIAKYLNSELKIGRSKLAEQIRTDLQEKASGIFMWVVLVTQILNKEHDGGRIHALRRRLRDIPGDLHELFRDILKRDHHNRGELLLCIQWVLFTRELLRPEQLYFAILSGVEPDVLSEWNPDEITAPDMKRFILNSSKGLAEVTKSKIPTVQFIHESVKDFLLKENGLREIWSDLGGNFKGISHERLKQCCLSYMRIDITTSLKITGSLPLANTKEAGKLRQSANEKFPFLEYATQNVLYHADAAEEGGISQISFLRSFQLPGWIKLDNLFEQKEVRRHTARASFPYILSERDMAALLKTYPSELPCG